MAKVLIIDDELAFRESMHLAFSRKGHKVATAMNADHAMNLLAADVFDLIILDVVMPGETGDVFLRKLRASQNRIPVVVYSVRIDSALEKEMLKAGANEVLNKSSSLETLTDRSEKVLFSAGQPLPLRGSAKRTLMIVDDEKSVRRMLCRFFAEKGYEIMEADGGQEAIRLVTENPPDLILLDMNMPGLNGLQTLGSVMKIQPRLGVIMATGEQDDEMVRQAMELGAYGYVLKPFDFLYLELVVVSRLKIVSALIP